MITATSITSITSTTVINTVVAATTMETTIKEEKNPLAIVLPYHCNLKTNSKRCTSGRLVCKEPQSCRFHQSSLHFVLLLPLPVKQMMWAMVPSSGRTICWWQYLDFFCCPSPLISIMKNSLFLHISPHERDEKDLESIYPFLLH